MPISTEPNSRADFPGYRTARCRRRAEQVQEVAQLNRCPVMRRIEVFLAAFQRGARSAGFRQALGNPNAGRPDHGAPSGRSEIAQRRRPRAPGRLQHHALDISSISSGLAAGSSSCQHVGCRKPRQRREVRSPIARRRRHRRNCRPGRGDELPRLCARRKPARPGSTKRQTVAGGSAPRRTGPCRPQAPAPTGMTRRSTHCASSYLRISSAQVACPRSRSGQIERRQKDRAASAQEACADLQRIVEIVADQPDLDSRAAEHPRLSIFCCRRVHRRMKITPSVQ